jgi:hypothetical protein
LGSHAPGAGSVAAAESHAAAGGTTAKAGRTRHDKRETAWVLGQGTGQGQGQGHVLPNGATLPTGAASRAPAHHRGSSGIAAVAAVPSAGFRPRLPSFELRRRDAFGDTDAARLAVRRRLSLIKRAGGAGGSAREPEGTADDGSSSGGGGNGAPRSHDNGSGSAKAAPAAPAAEAASAAAVAAFLADSVPGAALDAGRYSSGAVGGPVGSWAAAYTHSHARGDNALIARQRDASAVSSAAAAENQRSRAGSPLPAARRGGSRAGSPVGGGKGEALRCALSSPSAERQARKAQAVRFRDAADAFAFPGFPPPDQQRLAVSLSAAHSAASLPSDPDEYALLPELLEQQREFAAESAARRGGAGMPPVAGGAAARL